MNRIYYNDYVYVYKDEVWCRDVENGHYCYKLEGIAPPLDMYRYDYYTDEIYFLYPWGVLEYNTKRIYNIKNPVGVVRDEDAVYIATKYTIYVEYQPEKLQLLYSNSLSLGHITDIYTNNDSKFDYDIDETPYNGLEVIADGARKYLYNNDIIEEYYETISFMKYGKDIYGRKTNEVLIVNNGLVYNGIYVNMNEPVYYPVKASLTDALHGVFFVAHNNLYVLVCNGDTGEIAVLLVEKNITKIDGFKKNIFLYSNDDIGSIDMEDIKSLIKDYDIFKQTKPLEQSVSVCDVINKQTITH